MASRPGMTRFFSRNARASAPVDAGAMNVPSAETIQFRAFTANSIVTGTLDIDAERLTDQLNEQESLVLTNATVVEIETQHEHQSPLLVVSRGDLLIVQVTGPRGSVRRRFKTSPHAVTLTIGPYV